MGGGEGLRRRLLEREANDRSLPCLAREAGAEEGASAPSFAEIEGEVVAALGAHVRDHDERIALDGDRQA